MHNVTMWRLPVAVIVVEARMRYLVLSSYYHCQQYNNVECYVKMLLWKIYVAGISET
jgi:hypothetical protein